MRKPHLAGFLLVTVVACGGGTPSQPQAPAARPGDPAVYERIERLTDCAALQREFDIADSGPPSDWKVPYMEAADKRMRELGCYD
jgi:hypothetical protein